MSGNIAITGVPTEAGSDGKEPYIPCLVPCLDHCTIYPSLSR